MRTTALFTLLLSAALAFCLPACGTPDSGTGTGIARKAATADAPDVYPLMMGRTDIQVGTVSVWNDDTTVYVTYQTLPGYELQDAHLCVQAEPFSERVPPGQCRFKEDPLPPDSTIWSVGFLISDYIAGDFCGQVLYMQAHASIADAETDANVGSAYGKTFLGSYPYTLTCQPPPPEPTGCTLTQGYWKNHLRDWPVDELTLGGQAYSKKELIQLLKAPPKGDASLILAHQLIAAELNVANGAGTAPTVAQAMADAQAWMALNADSDGRLPYGTEPGSPEHVQATTLTELLDQFNQGFTETGHCDGG